MRPKHAPPSDSVAMLKRRLEKKCQGSSGCSCRRSHQPNTASARAATAKPPRMGPEVHPLVGPSVMDHTSAVRPMPEYTSPTGSARPPGWREWGTRREANRMAMAAMGTLTQNTLSQLNDCSRRPPNTGPNTAPIPSVADHRDSARARSRTSRKRCAIVDRVDGMMHAPPTPIRTRNTISAATSVAKVAGIEARPKTASPTMRSRCRPSRSATCPQVSSKQQAANATV